MSIPVATNVTIIGEAVAGAVVRGSYFYVDDVSERDSIYRWYIDGVNFLDARSLDFQIQASLSGAKIRFSVTPMNADGEIGIETFSMEIAIVNGYQNISDEEHRNSFMSQRGHCSYYVPDPNDKVFVASALAFSLTDGKTQSVHVRGRADHAGEPPQAIRDYLKNNPATRMFSTERDFGALVPVLGSTKRLLLWGTNMANIPPQLDLNNIKYVYSNRTAVAFIYDNPAPGKNTIGAFGNAANGGVVPEDIQRKLLFDLPKAIYATESAFSVLTHKGNVYAWGNAAAGGSISQAAENYLMAMKVERIVSTAGAFCAIGPQTVNDPEIKHVVAWGDAANGGQISSEVLTYILDQDGVEQVVANRNAFCAITKYRRRAISWGAAAYGGTMNEDAKRLAAGGNILLCRGSAWAFCMFNNSGLSASWGQAGYGGLAGQDDGQDNDAGKVFEKSGEKYRIEALFDDMHVNDWYQQHRSPTRHKANCDPSATPGANLGEIVTPNGIISLYSNDSSFFMVAKESDGRTKDLFSWGQPTGGGAIPQNTRQVLMASQITDVHCTNGAYGVISTQGFVGGVVSAFGGGTAYQDAGDIPGELQEYVRANVSGLYALKFLPPYAPTGARSASAFAARRTDGQYVVWGGGTSVTDELYNPVDS
ncbi:hypothetical protein C9382_14735 [Pseudomonas aylmerensis]|uniref:Uncharacterized protein n=1 Tax=Pseudomonas aylmerensis TaxID=1869229 RepID=A0A2T4FYU4_9PSED|nr:hypothetical protein [Pseudomonas aylmerensis]OCW21677.1 hypothetical protein BBG20_24080 [Pseudomonas aylmerensis]PTC28573.1 hypothetical protein C9382_14735 [Pseudomonas aylmerensis]